MAYLPSYLRLLDTGELKKRVASGFEHLESCDLCAWECRVNRKSGAQGVCRTGFEARIASYGPHMGEERPLSGWRGSGTIFFAGCNMRCQYCQNHDISQTNTGIDVGPAELAAIMLELQANGCHNINLVSPSHVIPQIIAAVTIAAGNGLRLPLVFNTGGYDSMAGLRLLQDVIDIYMPDMKYADPQIARMYSKTPRYPQANQTAVKEMHRQVGDLQIDQHGLALRGLLIRHLVLPNGLAGTAEVLRFIKNEISAETYLNLMDQYRPDYRVKQHPQHFPELARRVSYDEYAAALSLASEIGLNRLDRP